MARPVKCSIRLSPDSNQRLHADGQKPVWLQVAPGPGSDYRLTRPWCRGCVLDLATPVSDLAASVMEFFEDQKMLALDAAVIIESIEAARAKAAAPSRPSPTTSSRSPRSPRKPSGAAEFERNRQAVLAGETFAGHKSSDYRLGRRGQRG